MSMTTPFAKRRGQPMLEERAADHEHTGIAIAGDHAKLTRAAELTADTIRAHATSVTEAIKARMTDCRHAMDAVTQQVDDYSTKIKTEADRLGGALQACHNELAELGVECKKLMSGIADSSEALASQIEGAMKQIRDVRQRILSEGNVLALNSPSLEDEVATAVRDRNFEAERIGKKFGAGQESSETEQQQRN